MSDMNVVADEGTRRDIAAFIDALPFPERIPRECGDLAFDEPWEIRIFSLAVALSRAAGYEWAEFQRELAETIRRWESAHQDTADWNYYEQCLIALERLATEKGFIEAAELDEETHEILAHPPNRDHQSARPEPVSIA